MNFEIVGQRKFADNLGALNLIEWPKELPFQPKRVFWVTDVPVASKRGFHAHKTGHQILFCVQGSILLTLRTQFDEESVLLSAGGPGVWMKNLTWGEQTFLSEQAILMVLASNQFEESDYVRDFDEFLRLTK